MVKNTIEYLFENLPCIEKIQNKLPTLFQLSEIDNMRDGRLGMEIGSARERVIIALLIHIFGIENINTKIPITKHEVDVLAFDQPISIKTISGSNIGGIKIIWTVDATKSMQFISEYFPSCDLLLIQINWNNIGGLYLIKQNAQIEILQNYGRDFYFKMPKPGTNPRGVEFSNDAIRLLIKHTTTKQILINWIRKEDLQYSPYDRWIELWNS